MRAILAFLAIAIFAMVAIQGFSAGLEDAGEDIAIVNETWTPDAGNVTTLDDSKIADAYYADTVTVRNATSGAELDAGTDYEWFAGNGTVKALKGGELDGKSSALIAYEYQLPTETQQEFAALLGLVPQGVGFILPLFLITIVLIFARGG